MSLNQHPAADTRTAHRLRATAVAATLATTAVLGTVQATPAAAIVGGHDAAVGTHDQPHALGPNIQPLSLPTTAGTDDEYVGKMATVAGWGDTREDGQSSDVVQEVDVPIQADSVG